MNEKPDVSVIIVNWNTRDELRECLRSLHPSLHPDVQAEIIVVDNASWDDSVAMVKREFPEVKLIENRLNEGFGKAHNRAAQVAQGRYLLLLNSDARAHPGALKQLVDYADAHPDVGIIAPKVLNPDGSLQYSCRRFPVYEAGLFRNTLLGRLFPQNRFVRDYLMTDFDHAHTMEVDWVSGCAMMIRRETWHQLGGFDEQFFMYCEDVDLCWRAHEAGWKVVYHPDAVVTHAIGRSTDKAVNAMIRQFHHSHRLFFQKHYARRLPIWSRLLIPLGLWIRANLLIARNHLIALRLKMLGR
ncbi:MAG: glycosyltransferase family 2 protein [Armatimonadota bacterium]